MKRDWCCQQKGRGCEDSEPSMSSSAEAPSGMSEKADFCCLAADDVSDFCGTCYGSAKAEIDSHCGASKAHCQACGGNAMWCSVTDESSGGVVAPRRGLLLPKEGVIPMENGDDQLTLRVDKSELPGSIGDGMELRLGYGDMPPVDVNVLGVVNKVAE